jgi:hypothetical protein
VISLHGPTGPLYYQFFFRRVLYIFPFVYMS